MYEAMTRAYYENNAICNRANREKVYNYFILDKDFQTIEKGKCKNVSYRYDPCYDYNVVSFTDISTEKQFSICQFYIKLQEISK